MAWLYVIFAALIEVTVFTLIKAQGFSKLPMMALILSLGLAVPITMNFALKSLPLGTAYAAFVGIAIIGNVVSGAALFHESLSWQRLALIGLILVGVIGLRLLENPAAPAQ
jgi:quaternary ammonium compound-resistance protein SugE